jgi:Histidine phosphatase superfamily (branch 2)
MTTMVLLQGMALRSWLLSYVAVCAVCLASRASTTDIPVVVDLEGGATNRDNELESNRKHRTMAENTDSWYTRYPAYPSYCSTPEEMKTRKVPLLQVDKRMGETRLRHITVVTRHGARAPANANMNCWQDYETNIDTAIWNCTLNTRLSSPPPSEVDRQEGNDDSSRSDATFLFEKKYDALQSPLTNLLGKGTCQVGQLLPQGYEQELTNGQLLRKAYVYDEDAFDHDVHMRLLDVSSHSVGNPWDHVHFRVDDEMRTLMSGQVLLQGMLGPELDAYVAQHKRSPLIPLHTADYDVDVLYPNERVCPRLAEIRKRNQASPEFQSFNQSSETVLLRRFQREVLKIPNQQTDMSAIDCLMTTICTDRALPDAVNDYRRPPDFVETNWTAEYGKDMFQRLYEFNARPTLINAKADNGAYSKLAMSFLWSEIMSKINAHRLARAAAADDAHEKLLLVSGHDATILPLMASLGIWMETWPSYASMMIIELHELNIDGKTDRTIYSTNFAFRLIYNGVVMNMLIEGCPDHLELCDASILDSLLVLQGDCETSDANAGSTARHPSASLMQDIVSTPAGITFILFLVAGSAAVGGVIVFVYFTVCVGPGDTQGEYQPQQLGEQSDNGYHDESEELSERSVT